MIQAWSAPIRKTVAGIAVPLLLRHELRKHPASNPALAQTKILESLVSLLGGTFGARSNGLVALRGLAGKPLVEQFRKTVPIQRYSDIEGLLRHVERGEADILFPGRVIALAQTSGTTSASDAGERYIPQNQQLLDHHARGAMAALLRLCDGDGTAALAGRVLMLGGSTALERNAWGIPAGDLSGITVDRIPWYLRGMYEPGPEIALESDWVRKVDTIAKRLEHADVTLVSGVPSWCMVLFDAVCKRRGVSRIRDVWPRLRGFIHGGATIAPYIASLREHLPEECLLQEVYPSSEAFLGIGSRPWRIGEGAPPDLELLWNHGVFLELLPVGTDDGTLAIGPESLEPGQLYKIIATTPGGLVRHEIGDLVEGRGPGRVRFAGRSRTRISVFGEHVEGTKLAEALGWACDQTGSVCREFHVAPILPAGTDPRGAHEWWIEFIVPPPSPAAFAENLDQFLRKSVMDYDAHRKGDVQLLAPRIRIVSEGTFHRALRSMGKLGGQHKVPIAWPDREWARRLERYDQGEAG